jgi:hypothetical protein
VNVILALGLASWMTFARAARGSTLSVREGEYVMAARAGRPPARIVLRHVPRPRGTLSPSSPRSRFPPHPGRGDAELRRSRHPAADPSWGNMPRPERGYPSQPRLSPPGPR